MRGKHTIGLTAILLLIVACAISRADDAKFEVGAGGRIFNTPDVEALLQRPYLPQVPMTCSGTCLWAAHPDGWAFPSKEVNYYLITSWGLGFDVSLIVDESPIAPSEATLRPSHVRMSGAASGVSVSGAKWITRDNVLAVQLALSNSGTEDKRVVLKAALPAASPSLKDDAVSWTVLRNGMTLHCRGQIPGFSAEPHEGSLTQAFWTEGETPRIQRGSSGDDEKAAANGGRVLGSGFGSVADDYAVWTIDVTEPIEKAVLSVRYARATEGDAAFKVQIGDGRHTEDIAFASTGGWGSRTNEFGIVTLPLGAVEKGPLRVRAVSLAANSNVNIDTLYVHAEGSALPDATGGETICLRNVDLKSGATETVSLYLAVSTKSREADFALRRVAAQKDPLGAHVNEYVGWNNETLPSFTSSDEALQRQYWHRATSILRKNLFRVGEGRLMDWGISEGRWTSEWYANMISYGAGHQIREARWLRDPQYVRGIVSTWCANEKDNGIFPSHIRPSSIGDGQYTDWITSTVWDAHCVHPDVEALKKWADALKRNVDGWLSTYDKDNDGLLLVDSHWWTGMEWQPSFFFFNGFDAEKQDQQLERVDLTSYVYGNARSLAHILALIGDAEGAKHYDAIADTIREATKAILWDDASKYFYSVAPDSHEKAMVKEVVGVYPFYFSMFAGEEEQPYAEAWKSILSSEEFWTTWPVASASKKCPAYSQGELFHGKKATGCMWNGPTWPHANSIVLSAMAAALRDFEKSPLSPRDFQDLLLSFTKAQFLDGDLAYPWTGEFYNGDTAAWRTDQRDYDHSTYIDILIADLAGLRPRSDELIEVRPIVAPSMPAFVVDGIRYHNHDVTIAWNPPNDESPTPDSLKGYRVYVDGVLRHHSADAATGTVIEPKG
ncbi:MAG: hypothetical protein K1Y02_02150 [Candidatus Hydrogenedentes bacterium]|nr:hypothetical protein [Candidatus Hydrogenedentota bacterium]